jgi:hypothetical protein
LQALHFEAHFHIPQEGRTTSIAMDVAHDPTNMDMLTSKGFVAACYRATCIRPGGGLLAAPVCSSFVFMLLWICLKIIGFQPFFDPGSVQKKQVSKKWEWTPLFF